MKNRLWREKSFVIYLFGQTISSLGDGFYLIAFMWLSLRLSGGKGIVIGGVFSIYTLSEIILGFIAGPIVDRFNKKRILIVADILRGLLIFILYLLIRFKMATVMHLYIFTFAFSVFSSFFHRAEFAIIPQIVNKHSLLKANGYLGGAKRLMQVISPALSGVFISLFSIESCFLFDAISFFFSSLCISFIMVQSLPKSKTVITVEHFLADIKEGYRLLIGSSFLLTLAIYSTCVNFFGGPVFPLIPLISQKTGMGASGYGAMMSGLSAGLIMASFLVGSAEKYLRRIMMVLTGLAISAMSVIIMAFGFGSVVLIGSAFIMGVGLNVTNLPIITLLQEKVPKDKIGVVSSFVFTIAQIALPISMALSGFLVDIFTLKTIFSSIGIILFAGALIGFMLPQFKNENITFVTDTVDS